MRVFFLIFFTACQSASKIIDTSTTTIVEFEDLDGDGYDNTEDCDDGNPLIYPNAAEICDGIDNDCDNDIDEDVLVEFYADSDGDGFGNPSIINESCEQPAGYAINGTDCNDSNNKSHPGAEEICDGEDNNCDNDIDEGLNIDFFVDLDGDGFGDDNNIIVGCQAEIGLATIGGDCDDGNPAVSPISTEVCDDIDNNCNEQIDEGVQTTYYLDADSDGFGDPISTAMACAPLEGYVLNSEDCNDSDTQAYPNAVEFCDNVDNNCDGTIDEDSSIDASIWYVDSDGDGFGTSTVTYNACIQPSNYVANTLDCNDDNDEIHPNANEICNGEDDNCDGTIDEDSAIDALAWYQDSDEDGYGNILMTQTSCVAPSGYLADSSDCNDGNVNINPSADEICNTEDDDCNGTIDEAAIDSLVFYEDADEDGYGNISSYSIACEAPTGYISNAGDCDDGNVDINAGEEEQCNGIDDDCDGNIDDGAIGSDYSCPAESCSSLLLGIPSLPDGSYWIDPDGSGAVESYCDMTIDGGGWTLVAKFTNQDSRSWSNAQSNWIDDSSFGNTSDLSDGSDAKSELWSRMTVTNFMLNDHLSSADYIYTDDDCIGGTNLSSYFVTALGSFPYTDHNYYDVCAVQFSYIPTWATEPDWSSQTSTSSQISLNASSTITIAHTDDGGDTSGIISFYEASDGFEADVGLGALEDGQNYTNTGASQDIGGPTSCSYSDSECALEYPETVFFWVR
ncbi:MAG: hypothetical protein CL916_04940 [Deltaproteobacteria bacterium]|nr:hypothetical protein [Deltaproteobacteria bacterium]